MKKAEILNYRKPAFWAVVTAIIVCAAAIVVLFLPAKSGVDLIIHFPVTSEAQVFYTDEEVSSRTGAIEIIAGQGLGDTMVQLLPTYVTEENAYDEPQYITPGMPVKFQVEKGAWFRIGVGPLRSETEEDFYIRVNNVDVRIASNAAPRKLTLDDVRKLSQKGDSLTWSDFAPYQSQEIGSGLYILRYEIDERFDVLVGGVPDEKPRYVYLRANGDSEAQIDIRTENISAFLTSHENDRAHDDAQAAIDRAIREHYHDVLTLEADAACASFVTLETNAKSQDGGDASQVTYYGWALYEEYRVTENGLETLAGSHMPVALSFDRNEQGYALTEYWQPRDGSDDSSDIKSKVPAHIVEDMLDAQKYILPQKQACYAQAVVATGLDTAPVIGRLIEAMCTGPFASSAPEDYLDAHPAEYQELCYYGRYTLGYCFSRFAQGGETGLAGQIMARICTQIARDWGEVIPDFQTATGQDWYYAFQENALRLQAEYSETDLAERYPASYLLLNN